MLVTGIHRAVRVLLPLCLLVVSIPLAAHAQSDKLTKARKYHAILVKRPSPGYLFDRFYDAWLDQSTVENLQQFLEGQVKTGEDTSANRLLLAFFHAKQGDDALSLQQFRTALKDDPGNAGIWYEKAVVEARTLDYESALADLKKASEQKVDTKLGPKIAKLRGKLLVRSQKVDEAIAVWQQLLQKNSRDEDLYEDIIELQLNEGLYEQAAKLSETFVTNTKDPYKKVIRGIRTGDIYHRGGKREKALEAYSSNLEKLGSDSWIEKEVLAQIEQLFRREDDLNGLKAQYDKLLEKYPKRISLRKRYADLLVDLGEQDKAIEQFEQILKLTPGDRKNREEYIALLSRLEKPAEATTQLQSLIKQNADDPELRIQLANLLQQQDKKQEAGAAVKQYLSVAEKSEYAYLRAARLLARFELLDDANAVYQTLAKEFPESLAAKEALAAFLYDQQEKKEEAIAIWKQIAATEDRSQLVRVARILSGRKEHQAAFDLLKAREEKLRNDPIYLGQLVNTSIALERFEDAIPWASRRVQSAKTLSDLEAAIMQAADVVTKADKSPEIIAKMSKNAKPSIQQSCLLAELMELEGDSAKADAVLEKAEQGQAEGRKLFIVSQQIRLLNQRGEWAKAAEATKKLIGLPGGRKSIHVRRLVELYQRDSKLEDALTWTQQWKKLSPGSTLPWLTESRLLSMQGKETESLNVLRAAVQQFDTDMDLRARLAQAYAAASKLPDARRIYWRLYEDSEDVSSKLRWAQELGRLARSGGSVDRLVDQFEQRRENNRQSIVPLLALAEVHRESGDYEKRRDALLEATRVKPDDLELLFHIARIEETENDWEQSLKTLERAASIDKSTRAKERMARLHLRYGDPDKAYGILYELAGRENSDWQSAEAIADAMIGQQDWERAVTFLQPQIERFPNNYRLAYMYASALEETDSLSLAVDQFLNLLDHRQELPNRKTALNLNAYSQNYLGQLQGVVPPKTLEYMSLTFQTRSVYLHRQRGYRGGYSQTGSLQMPPDVDSARQYALMHLMEIGRIGLDEAEVESLDQRAKAKGVSDLALLRRMFPSMQNPQIAPSIFEDFPDDEAMLGLWAMTGAQRGNPNEELAKKVIETFKDKYPQLAIFTGMTAMRTNPEFRKTVFPLLEKVEKPTDFLISGLMQGLMQRGGMPSSLVGAGDSEEDDGEDAKMRESLTKQLLRWYPEVQKRANYQGPQLFSIIVTQLKQQKNEDAFLNFLDEEVARSRGTSKGNIASPYSRYLAMSGRGGMSTLLTPLQFPPLTLSGFPSHVLAQTYSLNGNQSTNPQIQIAMQMAFAPGGMQPGQEQEEFVKPASLKKIKDPTLRLLFASKLDQIDEVKQGLQQLLNAELPTVEGYLLAAGYAQSNEKPDEALKLLEKGRHLPMNRETRKQVDAAMVASALEIDKLSDEQKRIAVDAALRLRAAKLQPNDRQALIPALASLGLEKEADKLQEQQAKLANAQRFPTPGGGYSIRQGLGSFRPSRMSRGQTNPIEKLLKDGKKEKAVRAITTQLSSAATNLLANPMMGFRSRSRNLIDPQIKSLISRYKLKPDILKSVDPGDAKSTSKLTRYASVCLVLEEKDKARTAFEKILEIRPKDFQTRTQLMMMADDADTMLKYAKGLDHRAIPMFGTMVQQMVNGYDTPVEKRLKLLDGVRRYLDEMQGLEKTDMSWLSQVTIRLGQHMNSRGYGNYYPLYQKIRANREEGVHAEARRELHDNLCKTMMKFPSTADAGFALLLAAHEANKVGDYDFTKLANKALAIGKDASRGPGNNVMQQYGRQYTFRTPAEYLVQQAGKAGNLDFVRNELIPLLKKSGRGNDALAMEAYLKLLSIEPGKFVESASAYVKSRARVNPYGDESRRIFEVWKDRKLDVDISSVMTGQIEQQLRSSNYYQQSGVLQEYAAELLMRKGTIEPFMDLVSEAFLGPKAGQSAFIAKHYNRNQVSGNTPNSRIHAYRNLLQQMVQKQGIVLPVILHASELGLTGDMGFGNQLGEALFNSEKPEKAKELLAKSMFVKDVEEFRAYVSANQPQTVWDQALGYAKNHHEKTKQLLEGAPKTFGWELIRATVSQDVRSATVKLMQEYREKIDALPNDRKREISIMAKNVLNRFGGSSDDKYDEVVAWLNTLDVTKKETGFAEKILKARNTQQLSKDVGSTDRFQKQMMTLADSDRKKAKEVFHHVVKLAARSGSGGPGGPFGGGYGGGPGLFTFYDESQSFSGHLIGLMMGEHSNGEINMKSLGFVLDLMATADPEIPPSDNFAYRINRLFQRNRNGSSSSLERVKKVYKELGTAVGDTPVAILSASFHQMMQQFSAEDLEKIVEWSKVESESGEHQNVAKELLAAAKLAAARKAVNWSTSDDKHGGAAPKAPRQLPLDAYEHYFTTLSDEALPVTTREHICLWLLNTRGPREELVFVGADLLSTDKKSLVHSHDFLQNVLRRFSSVDRKSDNWKAAATKLTAYWNKTLLRPQNAQSARGNYFRQESVILPMMAINSELGQSKEFMKLFRMYGQNFSHSTALMAMMVRYDQLDEARGLFNMRLQNGNQLLRGYSGGGIAYSEELKKRIPAFLEKLKHTDERYVAQLLLASLPDQLQNDPNRRKQEDSPRKTRLRELSQKFASIEFGTEQMKEAVLALLLTHYPDSMSGDTSPIRDEVTKLISSYDMADSLDYRSGLMNTRLPLYKGHVRESIQRQDPSVIAKLIDQIDAVEIEERDHGLRQMLQTVLNPVSESMQKKEFMSWQKKDLTRLAEAYRKLSDPKHEQLHRYERNVMTQSIAFHVLAGEHEAFEKLFTETKKANNSQSTSRARSRGIRFYPHDLINMFGSRSSKDDKNSIPIERRIEIVGSLLRCLDGMGQLQLEQRGSSSSLRLQNHGEIQQSLEQMRLFKSGELAGSAEELAKIDGGYGWVMVAIDFEKKIRRGGGGRPQPHAEAHEKAKPDDGVDPSEKAIDAWKSAIAAAKNSESQTRFRLALANLYKRLKRNDEAKKVISEQKEVHPLVKPQVDRLLKSLSWVTYPNSGAYSPPMAFA